MMFVTFDITEYYRMDELGLMKVVGIDIIVIFYSHNFRKID